jgi:putative endonuclease
VAANWRTRFGELDLIARQGSTLVFVEVRTRTVSGLGTAGESVGPAKQRQLRLMAEQYLQRHAPEASARIDVVTIFLPPGGSPEIDHIVGAV